MKIRELAETDAKGYHFLRLRALSEHPTAFSSDYEKQRKTPLATVAERLARSSESSGNFILGCFVGDELVGTVGLNCEEGSKRLHSAVIYGMHVAVEHQGRGYGRALLATVLERARLIPGLTQVRLTVETTNEPARSLYASRGFHTYGVLKHALFVNGEYLDEDLMVLGLT